MSAVRARGALPSCHRRPAALLRCVSSIRNKGDRIGCHICGGRWSTQVLDADWEADLGSNALDMLLTEHFAVKFNEKFGLGDVRCGSGAGMAHLRLVQVTPRVGAGVLQQGASTCESLVSPNCWARSRAVGVQRRRITWGGSGCQSSPDPALCGILT
jgi:hypothetical protein